LRAGGYVLFTWEKRLVRAFPKRLSPALRPGQRRRGRRLDLMVGPQPRKVRESNAERRKPVPGGDGRCVPTRLPLGAGFSQRGDRLRRRDQAPLPGLGQATGKPVFQVRVIDLDPELSGRSREVVVKVIADRMPVPPTRQPFGPVEFENLTVRQGHTP
jgi:hypothetical protein